MVNPRPLNLGLTHRSCWLIQLLEKPVKLTSIEAVHDDDPERGSWLYFTLHGDHIHYRLPLVNPGGFQHVWAPDGFVPELPVDVRIGRYKHSDELYWIILDWDWYKSLPVRHDGLGRNCRLCHSVSASARMDRDAEAGSSGVLLYVESRPVSMPRLERVTVEELVVVQKSGEVFFRIGDGYTYNVPLVVLGGIRRFWAPNGPLPPMPCEALIHKDGADIVDFLVLGPEWFDALPTAESFTGERGE
jgi:hypothetical protein